MLTLCCKKVTSTTSSEYKNDESIFITGGAKTTNTKTTSGKTTSDSKSSSESSGSKGSGKDSSDKSIIGSMQLYDTPIKNIQELTFPDEIADIITSLPDSCNNIEDTNGRINVVTLHELSAMLYKMPFITIQQFIYRDKLSKKDYGKQIILSFQTLNDTQVLEQIDSMTQHFDLVLVCYPIIRDPFDEKVYVITVMNSKINIEPILTNHVELVALHYSQERRSYTIIKETKAFYKFILRYLQFLSLPNGIT